MTTIVAHGRSMAADCQLTSANGTHYGTKLFKVNGSIIGICGNFEQALKFIEWRRNPDTIPTFKNDYSVEALELSPSQGLFYWGTEFVAVPIEEPFYAIGSGSNFAIGAMAKGADAREALKVAAQWDAYTGSVHKVMTLAK